MEIEKNSAQVRFPPPLVYLGFLLIGIAVDDRIGLGSFGLPRILLWTGASIAIVAGIGLIFGAVGRFRSAGTPPEPWREVTAIVTTGIYRFTRNPMYLGMAAIHIGLALAFDSIAALLLLPVALIVIRTQVIAREEAYMSKTFGTPYTEYCSKVRRWL